MRNILKIMNRATKYRKLVFRYWFIYSLIAVVNLALMILIIVFAVMTYSMGDILGINNVSTLEYVLVTIMFIGLGMAIFHKLFKYYLLVMDFWFRKINIIKNKLNVRKNNR